MKIKELITSWQTEITRLTAEGNSTTQTLAEIQTRLAEMAEKLQDNPDNRALRTEVEAMRQTVQSLENKLGTTTAKLENAETELARLKETGAPPSNADGTRPTVPARNASPDAPPGSRTTPDLGPQRNSRNRRRDFF